MSEAAEEKAFRNSQRKPPVTIYDIARQTGVSPSTVSRALNKPGRINAKTELRIREAAASLDYHLNPMARNLTTGQTNTLGLLLSDITNPVYFDLLRGAGRVTAEAGYTLVLAESQESPELEGQTVGRMLTAVDGLVLVGTRLPESEIRKFAERKPVVLVNREISGLPSVIPDVLPGIKAALDYLAELNHRSIAFLSGPSNSWMSALRWETILDEALNRNMKVVEVGPGLPTLQGGQANLKRLRAAGVTAVLTYNDLMAIGLLTACQKSGISVPDELSIIGFDDIFGSDFTSPPLTTIRTPLSPAGEEAVQALMSLLRDEQRNKLVSLATELVRRGSTGPVAL